MIPFSGVKPKIQAKICVLDSVELFFNNLNIRVLERIIEESIPGLLKGLQIWDQLFRKEYCTDRIDHGKENRREVKDKSCMITHSLLDSHAKRSASISQLPWVGGLFLRRPAFPWFSIRFSMDSQVPIISSQPITIHGEEI